MHKIKWNNLEKYVKIVISSAGAARDGNGEDSCAEMRERK